MIKKGSRHPIYIQHKHTWIRERVAPRCISATRQPAASSLKDSARLYILYTLRAIEPSITLLDGMKGFQSDKILAASQKLHAIKFYITFTFCVAAKLNIIEMPEL